MKEQPNYSALLNQFMLQRRPYISIADALNSIYQNILFLTNSSEAEVAPFDFTLLKTRSSGRETFRWILGYDKTKFYHILHNKNVFSKHAKLLYRNIGSNPQLTAYYKYVLENPEEFDDIEFVTAVFHLTFRFIIPSGVFNVGLIHCEHKRQNKDYYLARLCINEPFDILGSPPLQIDDNPPQFQITESFYQKKHELIQIFLGEWIDIVQGLAFAERRYDYIYHLYFPVYDSVLPNQRSLKGYLGIFCANEETREKILDFFNENKYRYFRSINEAYKKGSYNSIVDSYKEQETIRDPIQYWSNSVDSLHQWGEIYFEVESSDISENIFWVDNRFCKISIDRLLKRKAIAGFVDTDLYEKYKNQVLSMNIPQEVVADSEVSIKSPYLRERILDVVYLLDELLRTRFMMVEEKRIMQATRKSAVAAVMSRNMSHNLGSHVLARYCTAEDFPARFSHDTNKKVATLNSFIRTRMDFLAALSTSQPTVVTSPKLYRDAMGYFKPVYADQEEFLWPTLLIENISGIEDLKSQNIKIRFINNGKEICLETPEIDPSFSCPNGLLGTHALYIIVENIIRNSAKHAYDRATHQRLEITFELNDCEFNKNLMEVCIYDNFGNANSLIEKDGEQQKLIHYLNEKIVQSILNEDGNLRGVAWGVLEMKICAAYLRKVALEKLDDRYEHCLLEAVDVDNNLGYRFFIYKPSEVFIVDQNGILAETVEVEPQSLDKGIEILNLDEFTNRLRSNIEHNFLVLVEPDESLLELVRENFKALPVRILTTIKTNGEFTFIDLKQLISSLQTPAREVPLVQTLWQTWLNCLHPSASLFIRPEDKITASKWQVDGISESSIKPKDITNLKPSKNYVIYDRHGMIDKNYSSFLAEKFKSGQVLYYQQVQLKQPTHFVIDNVSENHHSSRSVLYGLLETGIVKIVLLDERIQKVVDDLREDGKKLNDTLKQMNIRIPIKKQIDLDNPQNSLKKLTAWLRKHLKDATFLVVHLGVPEKLYNNNLHTMTKVFRDLESIFPNLNIIVVSGRGMPDTVRRLKVRFIQYSQVARYVLEERSKYHLCKVLFAARRCLQ